MCDGGKAQSDQAQTVHPRRQRHARAGRWALDVLARDSDKSLDQLADQAFRDLLTNDRRPLSFKDAFLDSELTLPADDQEPKRPRAKV